MDIKTALRRGRLNPGLISKIDRLHRGIHQMQLKKYQRSSQYQKRHL
uniref:Uncharacterized protein n=1 Tax=Siphoviridae sp. ctVzN31 TaxID=2825534 RepID=A0A8S5NXV6_9CAUD|nr:MAG TPA: hypothetical protein [Siphoviridae sp. ctVzN31]